ncbi:hypothetical protein V8C86DRAFT_2542205 [Haematococcus lacustris]
MGCHHQPSLTPMLLLQALLICRPFECVPQLASAPLIPYLPCCVHPVLTLATMPPSFMHMGNNGLQCAQAKHAAC